MFVVKNFDNEELETFFDIFSALGVIEVEADYMGQGQQEEFNFYCWNNNNEEIEITNEIKLDAKHKIFIEEKHSGSLTTYIEAFLKNCIPLDYKDNHGSFGVIKFKMQERDYEIIKFEYSESLESF